MSKVKSFVKKILKVLLALLGLYRKWGRTAPGGLKLNSLQGRKGLDYIDGLIDPPHFIIFIFEAFHILRGNLFATDIAENKVEIEEDHLQVLSGVLAEGRLCELLESISDIRSQFFRVSNDGHNTSFSGLSRSLEVIDNDLMALGEFGYLQLPHGRVHP
jgi:hypothetical protein